jgi:SAM-dependent methyltransferase
MSAMHEESRAAGDSPFTPRFFDRQDEAPDGEFYVAPRLLVHIDDGAIAAASALYGELLPAGGAVLDLMSSWRSHLPEDVRFARVAGLGMNAEEMRENPQLTEFVVHDLNAEPRVPFGDGEFDGAVVTVSVQYMTRPVEIFRDVGRVLKDGAPFIVTYSNRMFPTKAVRIWLALNDAERAGLIAAYFKYAGCFGEVEMRDCSRREDGAYADPLYAVWARKRVDDPQMAQI